MISSQHVQTVKATVPVLVQGGEALTRHFYRRMFAGNPEVLALFNPAHQHTGSQQKALAGAICAYAMHIDNPAALGSAVELIAQKHVSLGIRPEHYPIVGKHLLGSIQEVLGEAATPEILDAWGAAYGMLAEMLIAREGEIYAAHEREQGWSGFRTFVVQKKQRESAVITSLYLVPADGGALGRFKPGQYITVRVPSDLTGTTMRNYSLSVGPGASHYRISVKRERGGQTGAPDGHVSGYLHERLHEGDVVEVGPPCGEFTLKPVADMSRPLVLLSGGVGITPVLSMLHAAAAETPLRPIAFVHCAINGEHHAFHHEVLALAERHKNIRVHFRYSAPTERDREARRFDSEGYLDGMLLRTVAGTRDADFYFCGPKPFMVAAYRELQAWGVDPKNMAFEFFGPAGELTGKAAVAAA